MILKDGIRDGLSNLESRHNEGKKELDEFLKTAKVASKMVVLGSYLPKL